MFSWHLQLRITAIRETFEELGLLIGSRVRKEDRNGLWAGVIEDIDVKYWQDRLQKDPSDWFTLCKEHECYPDIWSLHYWSNWLTPVHLPRRFNTAFFVAAVDKKPKCLEGSAEVVNVQWLSPEEILSSGKKLQPPQTYELNRLSHVKDIQELVKFAKERSGYGVDLTYPVFIKVKDGTVSLLPGDDLYPSSVDYNDNTRNYIDQTILELRKSCYTVHRFESGKEINQLVTQNYKPKHHINMEDKSYQLLFKV
uniref:Nudix hydrolase domain-containing protein n=1 Tax=Heliothis virescens TaxID=7102 RepID=A0A2A4J3B6_HELVI